MSAAIATLSPKEAWAQLVKLGIRQEHDVMFLPPVPNPAKRATRSRDVLRPDPFAVSV